MRAFYWTTKYRSILHSPTKNPLIYPELSTVLIGLSFSISMCVFVRIWRNRSKIKFPRYLCGSCTFWWELPPMPTNDIFSRVSFFSLLFENENQSRSRFDAVYRWCRWQRLFRFILISTAFSDNTKFASHQNRNLCIKYLHKPNETGENEMTETQWMAISTSFPTHPNHFVCMWHKLNIICFLCLWLFPWRFSKSKRCKKKIKRKLADFFLILSRFLLCCFDVKMVIQQTLKTRNKWKMQKK